MPTVACTRTSRCAAGFRLWLCPATDDWASVEAGGVLTVPYSAQG